MQTPKVSVLTPVFNVEKYLPECLESLKNQTLKEIEFICINDGSTDDSLRILEQYAQDDPRFVIIDKPNSGYGASMNQGLAKSRGEFIGIVESDDFCKAQMFEELYNAAKKYDVQAVKSNYYRYKSFPNPVGTRVDALQECTYNRPFIPREDKEIFYASPAIWSGLYRRQFLIDNDIRFTETPGASYQDTAFNFKIWACATRALAVEEGYLYYRIDNENSSVKSRTKVDYVNFEYKEMEAFLDKRPDLKEELKPLTYALRFGTYSWNIKRLSPSLRYEYFKSIVPEFERAQIQNELDRSVFNKNDWTSVNKLLDDPKKYYLQKIGPTEVDVSVFIAVEDDGDVLKRTLNDVLNLAGGRVEAFCLPRILTPGIRRELRNASKTDKRIYVVKEEDFLNGALTVDDARGKLVLFMRTGAYVSKQIDVLISSEDHLQGSFALFDLPSKQSMKRFKATSADMALINLFSKDACTPVVIGRPESFSGMPVSPYSILTGLPLACVKDIAKQSKIASKFEYERKIEKRNKKKEKPQPITYFPHPESYKRYVEDFILIQSEFVRILEEKALSGNYYRFSFQQAKWLKGFYKSLPDSTVKDLSSEYVPKVFLNKILAIYSSENRRKSYDVSVIVPLYNKEKYVKACIGSICNQSNCSIEIVCVDDGSSDDSLNIALQCQSEFQDVVVIEQVNCGAGIARNNALDHARGKYVMFLDADDFFPRENVLERLATSLDKTNLNIAGGTLALFTEGKGLSIDFHGTQREYIFDSEGERSYRSHQYDYGFVRFMYRKSFLDEKGLRFPDYAWFEDPVFLVEALSAAQRFYSIPEIVYAYRQTHTAKEIAWTDERIFDLLRGLNHNLSISREHGYELLHARTLARYEADYYTPIFEHLHHYNVLLLVLQAESLLSIDLLRRTGIDLDRIYHIRPLAGYVERVRFLEEKRQAITQENQKLKSMTETRRKVKQGASSTAKYAVKTAISLKKNGIRETLRKAHKVMRRGFQK